MYDFDGMITGYVNINSVPLESRVPYRPRNALHAAGAVTLPSIVSVVVVGFKAASS
jgi:hypothetical protein